MVYYIVHVLGFPLPLFDCDLVSMLDKCCADVQCLLAYVTNCVYANQKASGVLYLFCWLCFHVVM